MQFLNALVVLATEEGGESGGGLSLVLPHPEELIAGILAFLIVFFFVWRKALPTINKTLEARQQAISGQLSDAEESKREAESLLADYRAQLAEAKSEGNRIIEEARTAGEQLKSDVVARAEEEAAQILAKAREEAQNEKARALAEARREVGEISVGLAEKIVGESLDDKMQQDLIDRYLADLERIEMDDRISGYATAILNLAEAEGELSRVESEFLALGQAVEKSADLRSTLTDPNLPLDKKSAVIDDLIGGRASSLTVGLVQFIVGQGRSSEIPEIARSFVEKAVESRSMALAEVRSAVPLDDATIERLAVALGKATGKKVEVKVVVDESVIGGIVARVGDVVIDGTVSNAITELRQAVLSR